MRTESKIGCSALAVFVLVVARAAPASQQSSGRLPPKLESFLATTVHPAPAEYQLLRDGGPITKLLDSDPSVETVAFGAVWINAPISRYVEAIRDIENFEIGGGFKVTKRISSPPRIEDFAQMRFPEEDLEDLRTCKVGDCEIKLSQDALERLRAEVDWKGPNPEAQANAVVREIALNYVKGYLEGGNERLAVYRDKSRPTFVDEEFRAMIDQMPNLAAFIPWMRQYLLDFPKAHLEGARSFLYWQETQFGLKPTLRISHMVVREGPEDTVVASKMLYASHYFWTALELQTLLPDPARGPGFWFVTVNRSRSDGLSGFQGRVIRGRVRSEVEKGTAAALAATKRRLENAR
ncbi:MAG: hypothetical protein AB1714_16210 [Acidobacteriota bacterium]